MPDDSGKLSPDDKQTVIKVLTERKCVNPCPLCGHPEWEIGDNMILHSLYGPKGFIIGAGVPSVVIGCTNCAFFRFHSAVLFGFMPQVAPKAEGVNG